VDPGDDSLYAAIDSQKKAFGAKLSPDGKQWLYRTTLGPARAAGLTFDGQAIYLTGTTDSLDLVVKNAVQDLRNGISDAFAAKIGAADGGIVWSTYLGGRGADAASAIAMSEDGSRLILAGWTTSSDFPAARSDEPWNGGEDGFVVELDHATGHVLDSAYIGTPNDDRIHAIAVGGGRVTLAGTIAVTGRITAGLSVSGLAHTDAASNSATPRPAATLGSGATLVPAKMTANAGATPQTASVGVAFANPLGVTVTDASGNPLLGVSVTFTAPPPGASGKFSNGTATITVATNSSGVASASFTANGAVGSYIVTATATGLTAVNFVLTNNPDPTSSITANAGATPQTAPVGRAFPNALAVTVKDASGNPVPGVSVTFTAPSSGVSGLFINGAATITVPTTPWGVASAVFGANSTLGNYNVTATATGLTAVVNFALTNNPGPAPSMTANAGATPQSTTIGTAFPNALAVTVKDASGNPVPGVSVTFEGSTTSTTGPSGKFSNGTPGITVATNSSGVASAPFTANLSQGNYYVTSNATGFTNVNFALTNNPNQFSMTTNAGTTPQTASVGTAFPNALAVTVKENGNPAPGVSVTFIAPPLGASGKFSNGTPTITVATSASGVASAPFTANSTSGTYGVTAEVTGPALAVNFHLTNNPLQAPMTANPGTTPQRTPVLTAFPNALAVTVKNASGNPVPNVSVTFTAPASGASGKFINGTTITVSTSAFGVASTPFNANDTQGSYNVTATAPGLPAVNFALTNLPGLAPPITALPNSTPQTTPVNTAFSRPLGVTVVPGVLVTLTAPASGASGHFINNSASITLSTDSWGVASSAFTANSTSGTYNVIATAPGLPAVNFALTNLPGPASSMTALQNSTPQTTPVNTAFARPLGVTVKDAFGNPVPGVSVTLTAPASGASGHFTNNSPSITLSTNSSGVVSSAFTANATAGSYQVAATATGLITVTFSLTN
jgi:hypothetical protein